MNESMCGTYYSSPTFTYKEGLEGLGLSIPMFIIHATYFPILLNFVIQVNIGCVCDVCVIQVNIGCVCDVCVIQVNISEGGSV